MAKEENITSLRVTKKFKSWLDENGERGESHQQILERLLDYKEED